MIQIRAEITGEIAIPSGILPARLLQAVKKELTFANPEYLTLKKLGKFCRHLPTTVQAMTDDGHMVRIPRGYGRRLHELAVAAKTPITWQDKRVMSSASFPPTLAGVTLRGYQIRAVSATMAMDQGVVVSPTGSGKSITAMEAIRRRSQKSLILVHNTGLMKQWRKEIRLRLKVEPGIIGGGEWVVGNQVTVAMIQTLAARPDQARKLAKSIGLLLGDEVHHWPAASFSIVISFFPAKYRYGFTATPDRQDGLGGMINILIGETLVVIDSSEVLDVGGIVPARIMAMNTGMDYTKIDPSKHGWTDFIDAVTTDQRRNRMVTDAAQKMAKEGRKVLVLTDRVEHAKALAANLPDVLLIHGKMPMPARQAAMSKVAEVQITVGTKGLLGEGLDCSVWSCLVMGTPMSGETPLRQAVGRVIRPAPGKTDGVVVDMVDSHPFALGAWRKRKTVYRKNQWPVTEYHPQRLPGMEPTQVDKPQKIFGRKVLALDLGQKTGWALLQTDGTITSGTMGFKPGSFEGGGMTFLKFKQWLDSILKTANGLDGIWFEEVRAHAGTTAAHVYGGFLGQLTSWAEAANIPYLGVPVGTIKKHATGSGNAGKDLVIDAMKAKGHNPADDNEADALAIMYLVISQ